MIIHFPFVTLSPRRLVATNGLGHDVRVFYWSLTSACFIAFSTNRHTFAHFLMLVRFDIPHNGRPCNRNPNPVHPFSSGELSFTCTLDYLIINFSRVFLLQRRICPLAAAAAATNVVVVCRCRLEG